MPRWDEPTDPKNPPKRWSSPVYGSGLLTTDTGVNQDYGYCFHPQAFLGQSNGIATVQSFSTHGFNPELQEASQDPRFNIGWHPFLATKEEAIQWLKDRNLEGEVLRYAHHKPLEQRVPTWEFESFHREHRWKQYRPWITAGVVAKVTHTKNRTFSQILTDIAGYELHNPDGSVVQVKL